MYRIESKIDPNSAEFKKNYEHHKRLAEELKERLEKVKRGGPESAHKKHKERGKLFVRDRLKLLLDPDTPFLELSPLAAWGMYNNEAPQAGIVTGIGVVKGREVMIVANDATVKGLSLIYI